MIPGGSRRKALASIPLALAGGALELTSIFSVIPFILLATHPETVEKNRYLRFVYHGLEFETPHSFLVFSGCVLLFIIVSREVFRVGLAYYNAKLSTSIQQEISESLLDTYLNQSFSFYLQRHSSELGQNVLVRVGGYMNGWFRPMVALISTVASLLVLLLGFLAVSPIVATMAVLIFGTIQLVIYRRLKPWLVELGQKVERINKERFRTAGDAMQGIREAKLLGCEDFFLDLYRELNERVLHLSLRRVFFQQWPSVLSNLTLYVVVIGAILAFTSFAAGSKLIALLALYLLLISRIVPKINIVFRLLSSMDASQAVVEDLHADLTTVPREVPSGPGNSLIEFQRDFGLRGASFSYTKERGFATQEVDLSIAKGSRLAVVGATGAGKTTLVDLLTGLLEPQKGDLLVDGHKVNPAAWRGAVGYASQELFLVARSVAENIAFGVTQAKIDMEAVERAARIACLHDYVMEELPDGYQSLLGERGAGLSRGQRQRVGIARALYRDPAVVFLDEATSGLDLATEERLLNNLSELEPAKTVVLVTHRLATASRCQQIAVIKKGRLVGLGSYQDLITGCPELQELMTVTRRL